MRRRVDVFDQETFQQQLDQILLALDQRLEVRLAPTIGMRVRTKSGPLRGVERWVEDPGVDAVGLFSNQPRNATT